jgi:N-acetylglucosamine kinase-like BadF-type ATPase
VLGFSHAGPGNQETVGYAGFLESVRTAIAACLAHADIQFDQLDGAGFGISGYDWPSQKSTFLDLIQQVPVRCPTEIVNDACLGILAGTSQAWGVAVVSGTGCNCWGWTKNRRKIGHVTGYGSRLGEGAGASELVAKAIQLVAYEWTKRGRATAITSAFIHLTGASDITDLIEGMALERYVVDASAAPLIFNLANKGDEVAREVITWAGTELGELALCVIRQLDLQGQEFQLVMVGSMFDAGEILIQPMRERIWELSPGAKILRLAVVPVVGACLLGMEAAGISPSSSVRTNLMEQPTGS